MAVSIDQIKALREATGAGVLDCRKTLEQTGGDFDKAMEILREKGLAKAAQRSEREASEGYLDLYSHGGGRVGVMVEINSETDFVARSEPFRRFAHEVALHIAAKEPKYIAPEDIPAAVLEEERARARQRALDEGKPEAILERIITGRLDKFMDENCLLRQPYVRDDTITVGDLLNQTVVAVGERVVIRRFVRWEVGEEIAH
jgi:elongation factor Ts